MSQALAAMLRTSSSPRRRGAWIWSLLSVLVALVFAFAVCGVLLAATGYDPLKVYGSMWYGVFGTRTGVQGIFVYAVPVMLTALAAAFAFQARIWNIGADGQLLLGAFGASWAALFLPPMPAIVHVPVVVLCGAACGALWALIPAVLRAFLGANEIMTTLMLNYVGGLWIAFFIYGPWRDPRVGGGWPYSAPFPESALLPSIDVLGTHVGLVMAILAAGVLAVILRRTVWGYEVRILGRSASAAKYAGIQVAPNILAVMAVSGAVAGLAGVGEVAGVAHRLLPLDQLGYGYIGILVAWLARLDPIVVVAVAILYGALLQGGVALQMVGVQPYIVSMLEAAIVIFLLIGSASISLGAIGLSRFDAKRQAAQAVVSREGAA